jgi:hypothetical protein
MPTCTVDWARKAAGRFRMEDSARAPTKRMQFQLRGIQINRVEAVSDAVFGFALTLLVVSLQVPRTYVELTDAMEASQLSRSPSRH